MRSASIPGQSRLPHPLRVMRAAVALSADPWLLGRMLGWALFLPVLKRALTVPTLARLMWAGSRAGGGRPERVERIATLIRWLYRAPPIKSRGHCLERSLLAYRFLSEAGADPWLVTGICRVDERVCGHAWVQIDGWPFAEAEASVAGFVPLAVFARGQLQSRA